MFEENAELWVGLWIDGGLEHRKENVLQHLAKVGHKVPASEDITEIEKGQNKIFEIIFQTFLHFCPGLQGRCHNLSARR